jgi:hypothetical protein
MEIKRRLGTSKTVLQNIKYRKQMHRRKEKAKESEKGTKPFFSICFLLRTDLGLAITAHK